MAVLFLYAYDSYGMDVMMSYYGVGMLLDPWVQCPSYKDKIISHLKN